MTFRPPLAAFRALAAIAALAAIGAVSTGCPFGPSSQVLAGADLEILVAGLAKNEAVHVVVDGQVRDTASAGEDPLAIFYVLGKGHHAGTLVVGKGLSSQCGLIDVDIEGGTAVVAFNAPALPLCDAGPSEGEGEGVAGEGEGEGRIGEGEGEGHAGEGEGEGVAGEGEGEGSGPDVGAFRELQETVNDAVCLTPPCSKVTTVKADGSLRVDDHNTISTGTVDDADLVALADDVDGADALFAGGSGNLLCPQINLLGLVLLERTVVDANGTTVTQTIDVSACVSGPAHEIRTRLDLLRSLIGL